TPDTGEFRLTAAIPFIDEATLRARSTGVPGVHVYHRNARALRLVADKRSQLAEAPTVVLAALAFANRHPASDVGQVFQPQRGLRVFGIGNKLVCNCMVDPSTKARFFPSYTLQATLRGFRPGSLIGLFGPYTALAHHFNLV